MMNNSREAFNVGILAAEFYCPPYYVDQCELEKYDKVSAGKYTIGLGQKRMSFCCDMEDVNSLSLTVFHRLIERYEIEPQKIGRLAVGTESIIDKSKSVSTVLMQIFESFKHWNVCGVDSINACFGGTQALLDAVDWIHSPRCKGRYAVVVMADIAAYAPGPARCTGGAGAVAFLIGSNAPIVLDDVIAFHKTHVYDFYKPVPNSEYPVVDGKLSIQCYTDAVERCYSLYRQEYFEKYGEYPKLDSFAGICFHTPYCKLVQKSLARLKCSELLAESQETPLTGDQLVDRFLSKVRANKSIDEHEYRNDEKALVDYSKGLFNEKTLPSLFLAEQIGNMYTSSLYAGLISLLLKKAPADLVGNNVLMFSYGSGSVAAMFSLKIIADQNISSDYNGNSNISTNYCDNNVLFSDKTSKVNKFSLRRLIDGLKSGVDHVLQGRVQKTPEIYAQWMGAREDAYGKAPYEPRGQVKDLNPATYHLLTIDDKYRRFYGRTAGKIDSCPEEQNGY